MIGQSVGSDASPLSCFLFRPRKRLEKCRKRSHINVSSTLSARSSTPPAQTAHVRFHPRKRVHTRLCSKESHTTAHTAKQGAFRMGGYHFSRSVPHVHQHPRAGYQNGKFCRFWGLVGDAPEERRKPSEQRCAYARRCSEGVAAPLGCVILFLLSKLWLVCHALRVFPRVRDMGGITTLGVLCVLPKRRTAACQSG